MDRYDLIKIVGTGTYGKALLCRRRVDNKKCIIKQITTFKLSKKEIQATELEAALLARLQHPNVISFWESFKTSDSLCIVMEFADAGDLDQFLKGRKGRLLSESEVLRIFIQIALAIKHIHDRKILHRDLKSQNIFLTSSGLVKLGDFGVSRVLRNTGELAATQIGTPYYMSPEIMDGKKYNSKTDIWSLGCLLYELMCLKVPFDGNSMKQLCHNIINAIPSRPPAVYSNTICSLATKEMLAKNPKLRPSVNTILTKDFIHTKIAQFLDQAGHENEFSHTVLHGNHILGQNDDLRPAAREQFSDGAQGLNINELRNPVLTPPPYPLPTRSAFQPPTQHPPQPHSANKPSETPINKPLIRAVNPQLLPKPTPALPSSNHPKPQLYRYDVAVANVIRNGPGNRVNKQAVVPHQPRQVPPTNPSQQLQAFQPSVNKPRISPTPPKPMQSLYGGYKQANKQITDKPSQPNKFPIPSEAYFSKIRQHNSKNSNPTPPSTKQPASAPPTHPQPFKNVFSFAVESSHKPQQLDPFSHHLISEVNFSTIESPLFHPPATQSPLETPAFKVQPGNHQQNKGQHLYQNQQESLDEPLSQPPRLSTPFSNPTVQQTYQSAPMQPLPSSPKPSTSISKVPTEVLAIWNQWRLESENKNKNSLPTSLSIEHSPQPLSSPSTSSSPVHIQQQNDQPTASTSSQQSHQIAVNLAKNHVHVSAVVNAKSIDELSSLEINNKKDDIKDNTKNKPKLSQVKPPKLANYAKPTNSRINNADISSKQKQKLKLMESTMNDLINIAKATIEAQMKAALDEERETRRSEKSPRDRPWAINRHVDKKEKRLSSESSGKRRNSSSSSTPVPIIIEPSPQINSNPPIPPSHNINLNNNSNNSNSFQTANQISDTSHSEFGGDANYSDSPDRPSMSINHSYNDIDNRKKPAIRPRIGLHLGWLSELTGQMEVLKTQMNQLRALQDMSSNSLLPAYLACHDLTINLSREIEKESDILNSTSRENFGVQIESVSYSNRNIDDGDLTEAEGDKDVWFDHLNNEMEQLKDQVNYLKKQQISVLATKNAITAKKTLPSNKLRSQANSHINENSVPICNPSTPPKAKSRSKEEEDEEGDDSLLDNLTPITPADVAQRRKAERVKRQQEFREFIRAKKDIFLAKTMKPVENQEDDMPGFPKVIIVPMSAPIADLNLSQASKVTPHSQHSHRSQYSSTPNMAPGNPTSRQSHQSRTPSSRHGKKPPMAPKSKSPVRSKHSKLNHSSPNEVKYPPKQSPIPTSDSSAVSQVRNSSDIKAKRDAERLEMKKVIDQRRKALKIQNDVYSKSNSIYTTNGVDIVVPATKGFQSRGVFGALLLSEFGSAMKPSGVEINVDFQAVAPISLTTHLEPEIALSPLCQSIAEDFLPQRSLTPIFSSIASADILHGLGRPTTSKNIMSRDDVHADLRISQAQTVLAGLAESEQNIDSVTSNDIAEPGAATNNQISLIDPMNSRTVDFLSLPNNLQADVVTADPPIASGSENDLLKTEYRNLESSEYNVLLMQLQSVMQLPSHHRARLKSAHKQKKSNTNIDLPSSINDKGKCQLEEANFVENNVQENVCDEIDFDSDTFGDSSDEYDECYDGDNLADLNNKINESNDSYDSALVLSRSHNYSNVIEDIETTESFQVTDHSINDFYSGNIQKISFDNNPADSFQRVHIQHEFPKVKPQSSSSTYDAHGSGHPSFLADAHVENNDIHFTTSTRSIDRDHHSRGAEIKKTALEVELINALGVDEFHEVTRILAEAYRDDVQMHDDEEDSLLEAIEQVIGVNGLQYLDDLLLYLTLESSTEM